MGTTTDLKNMIMSRIDDLGIEPPGKLYPPDDVPKCARDSGNVYGEYSWIGVKDDRSMSQLIDEYWIQFQFFGNIEDEVNNMIDLFADSLDSNWHDGRGLDPGDGTEIFMRLDYGAPKIPAMKSSEKDRFSKYTGMCQFRIRVGKTC